MHLVLVPKKVTGCESWPIHVLVNYSLDTGEWAAETGLASKIFIRPSATGDDCSEQGLELPEMNFKERIFAKSGFSELSQFRLDSYRWDSNQGRHRWEKIPSFVIAY